MAIDRRDFLKGSVWAAASAALAGCEAPGATFEISLAQWSLHRHLFGEVEPKLDNLGFAEAARGFGIDAVEYVNQFFQGKVRDEKYVAEMGKRASDAGVRSLLIMCDGLGRLGDPKKARRRKAVANHVPLLAAAQRLGCDSIRVNAESAGSYDEQMKLAADGLAALAAKGKEYGLGVIVENHGGLSANGAWVAGVIRRVGMANCGTLPDFGNFQLEDGTWYDRYKGVKEMMPYAKAISAKSRDFDEDGNEVHTDYSRMLGIVVAAGYHGHLGIEYEGERLSEADGIRATKKLLERVRAKLSD